MIKLFCCGIEMIKDLNSIKIVESVDGCTISYKCVKCERVIKMIIEHDYLLMRLLKELI